MTPGKPERKWWTARKMLVAALVVMVGLLVARRFDPEYGFTTLIQFDSQNKGNLIPELEAVPRYIRPVGYDGQLYAQLAIDPTLRHPFFRGLDKDVQYRARRIFLPMLAHVLGGGRPAAIVHVYSVLNIAFWLLLLWILLREDRRNDARVLAVVAALALTTGVMESVRLALTDLPALALLLLACGAARRQWWAGTFVFGTLAALTRETMALALPGLYLALNGGWRPRRAGVLFVAGVAAVVLAWNVYLGFMLYARVDHGVDSNFGLPFIAIKGRCLRAWTHLGRHFNDQEFFTLAAAGGFLIQAGYLWWWRRWREPLWVIGFAFSLFFPWIGPAVWASHLAVCRILLPMTVAFNWLLLRHEARRFWWWFGAGNFFGLYGVWKFWAYRL